ncbi:MAG: hypothetical protein DWH97_07555 [Planctomycetota bacterium]|jgi:hypothetical protein|nr:MAG: hypothetical protein DWH97_07555 [Planctomycetota bacterium]RLS92060.1 MAG: hypothetical protein DWI12_12110 [Planctomycetota bacterium]
MDSSIRDMHSASDSSREANEQQRAQPLFRFDPGWPFVVAGLGLLVCGVLIPAQRDLQGLQNTLKIHRALEDQSLRQRTAYDRFLVDLDQGDEQLIRRLAASQLNLMPEDERSLLLTSSMNATVTDWIEASEPVDLPNPAPYPDSLLARLATGPRRLWVLACGAFLVFVGLMLAPSTRATATQDEPTESDNDATDSDSRVALVSVAELNRATVHEDVDDRVHDRANSLTTETSDAFDADASSDEALQASSESTQEVCFDAETMRDVTASYETTLDATVDSEPTLEVTVDVEPTLDATVVVEPTLDTGFDTTVESIDDARVDDAQATDEPDSDNREQWSGSVTAFTQALEYEQEVEPHAALPDASNRALDTLSLFHGVDDARWIDTRDLRRGH